MQNLDNSMMIDGFNLPIIYNSTSLNLFSDASMRNRKKNVLDSCYGSIAVCKDTIVDEDFKLSSSCTVPAAELRGIRLSLDIALRHRYEYKTINIFSDSQISVFTLRNYFYKWKYDYNTNMYYTVSNVPAKNQELIIECIQMLDDLRQTNIVNIYHQKGHIENGMDSIKEALECFKKFNSLNCKIDYSVIRYISTYNNYVDNKSRSIIRRTNIYENTYRDPITFHPLWNPSLIYQNQI